MMELKITLAILLQSFRFSLVPNQRINRIGLTGSIPKNGIKMKLNPMNEAFTKMPVSGNIHRLIDLT